MSDPILVLLRHGQSVWNLKNVFTGWVDVPLTPKGIEEALSAGDAVKDIPFSVAFTSTLVRAQMTLFLALSRHSEGRVPVMQRPDEEWSRASGDALAEETLPVFCHSALNERMYGKLQGLNKDATREKFGADQVKIWRRSYDIAPPDGESLKMTKERALPYFDHKIKPYLEKGENVIISAHGNSLRAIMMELDDLNEDEVVSLEIPTGVPIAYRFKGSRFEKIDL